VQPTLRDGIAVKAAANRSDTVSRVIDDLFPRVPPARRRAARHAGDDYGVGDSPDWRSIDWGSHRHTADVLGTPVNYVDIGEQGDARPIVFVHGLGGQWQNWLENIPRFAEQRRVVAMDLPGFGLSPMPQDRITIDYYGRVVEDLCRQLDLAPVVLVGNSMGGYVSAEVAIKFPETVERMLLLSAAGISQRNVPRTPALATARLLGLFIQGTPGPQRLFAGRPNLRHWTLSGVVRHPTLIRPDLAFEGLLKGAGKPGFLDALVTCLDYDFRDRLPEIGCPTLVVWGRQDMIVPVRDADKFVELVPGSRKIILENTGHVPMVERPRTFNDHLEQFLHYVVSPGELEDESNAPASEKVA
jgi:pimeloyl-ACP methyl ester carboxylesterase